MAKSKAKKIGEIAYKGISNWEGGMNDIVNAALLNENESPLLENASLDEKGTLSPRRGSEERYSANLDAPVAGMGSYYKSDGTAVLLIATHDGCLYIDTPHLVNAYKVQSDFEQGTLQAILTEVEGKLLPMEFSTGFEDSSFVYFHTQDTGWAIDSSVFKSGAKSAKGTGSNQKLIRKLLFDAGVVYLKQSARFGEKDKAHYPVILISQSGSEIHAVVADADGKFKYHNGTALTAFPVAKAYEASTFYDIEIWVRGGTFWVAVDGVGLTPSGVAMKDTAGTAQSFVSEIQFKNGDGTTMWLDNLVIDLLMPVFSRPSVIGEAKENKPRYEKILF